MSMMSRNVREAGRRQPMRIGCPIRGCDGVLYTLKAGEHLSRTARAGWHKVSKNVECPDCGYRRRLDLLARGDG